MIKGQIRMSPIVRFFPYYIAIPHVKCAFANIIFPLKLNNKNLQEVNYADNLKIYLNKYYFDSVATIEDISRIIENLTLKSNHFLFFNKFSQCWYCTRFSSLKDNSNGGISFMKRVTVTKRGDIIELTVYKTLFEIAKKEVY